MEKLYDLLTEEERNALLKIREGGRLMRKLATRIDEETDAIRSSCYTPDVRHVIEQVKSRVQGQTSDLVGLRDFYRICGYMRDMLGELDRLYDVTSSIEFCTEVYPTENGFGFMFRWLEPTVYDREDENDDHE